MKLRQFQPRLHRSFVLIAAGGFALILLAFELLYIDSIHLIPWRYRPSLLAILFLAAVYPALKVLFAHPLYDSAYFDWLSWMPWRSGRPLPLGPVLPSIIDIAVVGALAGLAAFGDARLGPIAVLMVACGSYAFAIAPALSAMGLHMHVYAMIALVGVGILLGELILAGVIAVLIFAVAADGARRSILRLRPGPDARLDSPISIGALCLSLTRQTPPLNLAGKLGSPYATLAPRDPGPMYTAQRAFLLPLAVAFVAWTALHATPENSPDSPHQGFGIAVAIIAAAARLLTYTGERLPPVSLVGRVRLGMPLIPRYDVVLIAPAAAVLSALILWRLLISLDAPLSLVVVLPNLVALWIVLLAPPTLRRWDLTGAHRLQPSPQANKPVR